MKKISGIQNAQISINSNMPIFYTFEKFEKFLEKKEKAKTQLSHSSAFITADNFEVTYIYTKDFHNTISFILNPNNWKIEIRIFNDSTNINAFELLQYVTEIFKKINNDYFNCKFISNADDYILAPPSEVLEKLKEYGIEFEQQKYF
ncbi:MAG: hypothetical protein QXV17_12980 [Candidatus Micrarchaeaceae archaeon]